VLILSRKEDQSVVFPNCGIVVHVLGIKGRTIRLGFEAPRDVAVLRGELVDISPPKRETTIPIPNQPRDQGHENRAGDSTSHLASDDHCDWRSELQALKSQLGSISHSIQIYHDLVSMGHHAEAERLLQQLLDKLSQIDGQWDVSAKANAGSRIAESPSEYVLQNNWSSLRLLIVDMDSDERESLALKLRARGCECITVASGDEAISTMRQDCRFDFALLDTQYPGHDVFTTLRAIRADARLSRLRVFSVSGSVATAFGVTLDGQGFDGWLPKPVNPSNLWNHMQECLRRETVGA
jgi:carbon storage regulator CsrA